VVTDPQTNKQTHTQTDRGDYNTLRAKLRRSVVKLVVKLYVFLESIDNEISFVSLNLVVGIT